MCKARAEAKFTWIMPSRSQTSVENEILMDAMLIGREQEKQVLLNALNEEYSQFIAVYK